MSNCGYATSLRNAKLDAITTFAGNGAKLQIYNGTQPATGAAITSQTKLSEHTLASPFASGSSGGVLSPTAPSQVNALATGTASWFRIYKADGTTFVMDGAVGVTGSGAPCIVNSTSFTSGVGVAVTSMSFTDGNP